MVINVANGRLTIFRENLLRINVLRSKEQIQAIEMLKQTFSHSIRLIQEVIPEERKTWAFNCYEFALGLRDRPEIKRIASGPSGIFPGDDFAQWFLTEKITLEITWDQREDNDLVVYLDKGQVRHFGLIHEEKIISKWGGNHIWEHGLFEVPINYGDEARFFKYIIPEKSVEAFLKYYSQKQGKRI